MKRFLTTSVSDCTRSKRPKLFKDANLVSATSLYNYMLNDHVVDWIKYHNNPVFVSNKNFSNETYLMSQGIKFEKCVIEYINKNIYTVEHVSQYINDTSVQNTIKFMHEGKPIIHSAPVRNYKNGTQGIIDLLVRSDYVNQLCKGLYTEENTKIYSPNLNKYYHYVVFDIKYSTLQLLKDGIHLSNCAKYQAYKAQCYIYTQSIGDIQGYHCPYAYLIGRKTKYTEKGIQNWTNNFIDKFGQINFDKEDNYIIHKTDKALKWVNEVIHNGHNWNLTDNIRDELYPNMSIDSGKYNKQKEIIADKLGEITQIWNLGIKHREIAFKKGIKSWRDKRCKSKNLNIKNVKKANIIDKICNINRQDKTLIKPKKIYNNIYNWRQKTNEIFIDFETFSNIFDDFSQLPRSQNTDMIFMIGIGYTENNTFKYKHFLAENNTIDEEYRIIDQFVAFYKSLGKPKIYNWVAEENFWIKSTYKQFEIQTDNDRKENISKNWNIDEWCDLCHIFKSEPIVIKDCFNFSLKNIAKAMYKHNMIETSLQSNTTNGMLAMIKAMEIYKNDDNVSNNNVMKDIIEYNKFDCKVLWEILTYLRNNH